MNQNEPSAGQKNRRRLKINIEMFISDLTSTLELDGFSAIQLLEDYFTIVLEYLPDTIELGRGDFTTTATELEITAFSQRFILAANQYVVMKGSLDDTGYRGTYSRQDSGKIWTAMQKLALPEAEGTFRPPEYPAIQPNPSRLGPGPVWPLN